ncbi:MAG: histidine phosphatase family protein [Acidobacteriota bacterium]
MKSMLRVFVLATALSGIGPLAAQTPEGGDAERVIFLTRHAEAEYPYQEDPRDPPLTALGRERAKALAHALSSAGVTQILSSGYRRTRSTAAPLAQRLGLEVESYDAQDPQATARRLRKLNGRIYVAGHSNTTPELVALLGGDPGAEIDPVWEHDRLYVVTLDASGGHLSTTLVRYGAPSKPPPGDEP